MPTLWDEFVKDGKDFFFVTIPLLLLTVVLIGLVLFVIYALFSIITH